jgi:hypothetical protein
MFADNEQQELFQNKGNEQEQHGRRILEHHY